MSDKEKETFTEEEVEEKEQKAETAGFRWGLLIGALYVGGIAYAVGRTFGEKKGRQQEREFQEARAKLN